jgi:hypothetical protein
MFDAGGQHFKGKASKYTASRAPQALSSVPRSVMNTIRYSFKSRERYAAGLSLAPLLFLNSLCAAQLEGVSRPVRSVINLQWFLHTSIMFFFSKMDDSKGPYH